MTILFADLVDSTVLSTRVEPETYRMLVGRYRDLVLTIVNRYEGHIGSTQGDGLLAVFGHPTAHEDDVRRAVLAGLEITREVSRLSDQAQRRFGIEITVRVGVHRGLVYLDTAQDDVYGSAAVSSPTATHSPPRTSPIPHQMTPADLRSPTFTPHGRSSATSTVASDSRHTRNRASSSSWAGRVPAHVYSPALLELEPHHSGVGGIVLRGQRGRVAPRSDVVRPLGHLGPMAAEPFGVPLQRGAAPEVAAVEATRHQLAAYPGTGMAGIPVPVILAIPRTRLSPAPPVGIDHLSPLFDGTVVAPFHSTYQLAVEQLIHPPHRRRA